MRKVAATLRDSVFQEVITILHEWKLYDECKINRTLLTIELPNGSIFIFKGLDDPEKIKSINGIDDIVIEEATELTLEDYSQLDLRLRSKKPHQQIVCMFNPVSKDNYVYDYFVIHTAPNKKLVHTTYKDNKFLPKEYVESLQALAQTNPHYYKIYVLGEWASLDKLIFPEVKVVGDINVNQFKRDQIGVGVDFGFTADPTAIVLTAYDSITRTLYVIDEVYGKEMLTDDIADVLKLKGWTKYRIVGDCASARVIRELYLKGIPITGSKKGSNSILHGVTFLQQQNIIVSKKCEKFLMETRNYTWAKDRQGQYINKPIDKFNHLMDATRYIMERYALTRTGGGNSKIKQILGI